MLNDFLWNRVLGHISKRERCEKEVREYIKRISVGVGLVPVQGRPQGSPLQNDEIIQKLKSLDFLNDDRFTKAYVHDNYNLKHKGKNRIRQELKNKGINESTIDIYLNEIGKESEVEKALELAKKRREFMKNLPILTQKRRLYGFLVRRGFEPKISLTVIDMIVGKR